MELKRAQDANVAVAENLGTAVVPAVDVRPTFPGLKGLIIEPFRIANTELPGSVLLLAKTLTLAFLATGQIRLLSWHFLPFLRFFDRLGSPAVFHWALVTIFLGAAAALFYNRGVRTSCLVLGSVILISLLSSRLYFENNRAYCACILLLAGLSTRGQKPWPLRLQVVLVYFGAALNKLLQADWRSGQFFAYWFGQIHHPQLWWGITRVVPAMPLAQVVCWTTIVTEFVLVVGFLVPRWYSRAIWLGVAYHTTLLLVMNSTFGMFYYAMLASYLAFVEWPQSRFRVIYQSNLGFIGAVLKSLRFLDADRRFEWTPIASGENLTPSMDRPDQCLFLIDHDRVQRGFAAFKRIVLWSPASYCFLVLMLARQPRWFQYHRWLAAAVLVLFTPFLCGLGEFFYRLVTRQHASLASERWSNDDLRNGLP